MNLVEIFAICHGLARATKIAFWSSQNGHEGADSPHSARTLRRGAAKSADNAQDNFF